MKKLIKDNYKLLIVILIHFGLTFISDHLIFNFAKLNVFNYITCKIILLIILSLFWNFIFKVIKKDKRSISYLKCFLVYFIPILILMILCWPGNWFADDVANFYNLGIRAEYLYYLNYLSSIFYIVSFMLFPVTSGPCILLSILFGITCSYLLKNLYDIYKSKLVLIILIPFFMLNTLFYTFFANRPIMYGISYLLLISILLIDKFKKNKLTTKKLIVLIILTGIVGFWRSESIYLILAIPLFIFIVYKVKVNFKNIMKILGLTIIAFIIVAIPQKVYEYHEAASVDGRNLPMYLGPLPYMISQGLKGDNLDSDLANIDKILNIEKMEEYPVYEDTVCVWMNGCINEHYTKEEFEAFQKSYFNVIKNNFPLFLKTKILTFANASGIYGSGFTTRNMYNDKVNTIFGRSDTKPFINYKIRKLTYSVLEGKFDDSWSPILPYRLTNNLFISLIIIGLIFIYAIIKKKLFYFLLTGMLFGHTLIVFLTAPGSYFMYYFNVYLVGLTLGCIFLIDLIYYKRHKKSYVLEIKKNNQKSESKLKKLIIQAFKFFGISGIGWVIDFSVYTILSSLLNINIIISNIISSFFGITFVYLVSTRKIFVNDSKYNLKVKYIVYILYQVVLVLLSSYIMSLIKKFLIGFDINLITNYVNIIAKIIVTPFTMVMNFIVMKNLIEKI